MKHTLMLLFAALAVMFVSCNQGSGDAADKQKIIDSLVKLIPANKNVAQHGRVNAVQQFSVAPYAANYEVTRAQAAGAIENWHQLVTSANLNPAVNSGRTAFLVPAVTLDSLINSIGCTWLVFYIGETGLTNVGNTTIKNAISLYYTGVQFVGTDSLTEIDITNSAGDAVVFYETWPCPTCSGVGIHAQNPINAQYQ